jgi:outer membrane translocation and assembly module TamA
VDETEDEALVISVRGRGADDIRGARGYLEGREQISGYNLKSQSPRHKETFVIPGSQLVYGQIDGRTRDPPA